MSTKENNHKTTQYEIFNIVEKIDENGNKVVITLLGNYAVDVNETIEQATEKIDKKDWELLINVASLTSYKVFEKSKEKEVENEN